MDSWIDWEVRFNSRFQGFLEAPTSHIEEASLINLPDESNIPNEAHSPSQVGVPYNFLGVTEGWNLPLEALRRLPRYLCAMTLLSDGNPVNQGHYEYWRYTGTFASVVGGFRSPIRTIEQFDQMTEDSQIDQEQLPDWFTVPLSRIELNDFCLLLYLGLLGLQKTRVRMQQINIDNPFISGQPNPSINKLIEHSFNLTTRYGFPVLEGFAGKWKQESSSSLQNKLEDWIRNTTNDKAKLTLIEVNALSDIDVEEDVLNQMYATGLSSLNKPSKTFGVDSIFYQLNDARWKTQHGDESYSGPAVVVATLSCLAFWDLLGEQQYTRIREWINRNINKELDRQERIMRDMGWKPEKFYNHATVNRL